MTAVLLGVAAVAAVACPAHMLWRLRRGRAPTCGQVPTAEQRAGAVRRHQRDLETRIAQLQRERDAEDRSYAPT